MFSRISRKASGLSLNDTSHKHTPLSSVNALASSDHEYSTSSSGSRTANTSRISQSASSFNLNPPTLPASLSRKVRSSRSPESAANVKSNRVILTSGKYCGYCDMPVEFTLDQEAVVELQCGHNAHLHCFRELMAVCPEGPPCGICDRPGRIKGSTSLESLINPGGRMFGGLSEESPHDASWTDPSSHSVRTRSTGSSIDSSTRTSSDASSTQVSERSPQRILWPVRSLTAESPGISSVDIESIHTTPRLGEDLVKSGSLESVLLTSSSDAPLETALSSLRQQFRSLPNGHNVVCDGCDPLWIAAVPATELIADSSSSFRMLLTVSSNQPHATEGHDPIPDQQEKEDMDRGLQLAQLVSRHSFRGILFSELNPGSLRLQAILLVKSKADVEWCKTECYLFENYIVLMRENQITAVFDVWRDVDAVEFVEGYNRVLQVSLSGVEVPELLLQYESDDSSMDKWDHALHDATAVFPFLPRGANDVSLDHSSSGADVIGDRTPVSIIICLPAVASSTRMMMLKTVITSMKSGLRFVDKFGLVLYTQCGIAKTVPLQQANWSGWGDVLRDLRFTPSNMGGQCNLDQPLQAASDMLESHKPKKSAASVILVTDHDSPHLRIIPPALLRTGTAVHGVGFGETHDPAVVSSLAKRTGGAYHYVRSHISFPQILAQLLNIEKHTTHRSVRLMIKPRIGLRITGVLGDSEVPDLVDPAIDNISVDSEMVHKSTTLELGGVNWPIGRLSAGDSHSLILEVAIDDTRYIAGKGERNVLLIEASAAPALALVTSRLSKTSSRVTIPVGSASDVATTTPSPLFEAKEVTIRAAMTLGKACALTALGQVREAFQLLDTEQQLVRERAANLREAENDKLTLNSLYDILAQLYDQQCNAIVQPHLLTRHLVLTSLQSVWLLRSENAYIMEQH